MIKANPIETAPLDRQIGLVSATGHACAPCMWSPPGEISEHGCWCWFVPEPSFVEFLDPVGWFDVPYSRNGPIEINWDEYE